MRPFAMICLFVFGSQWGFAQVKAYRIGKPNITGVDESISITVDPAKDGTRGASIGYLLPGLVGNLVTTGLDLIKSALSNEEQKYTATYSGSTTGNDLMKVLPDSNGTRAILNMDSVHVIRKIVQSNLTSLLETEIVLVPEFDKATSLFRFKLSRLFMDGSKAKVKKLGKKGKVLDLNIEIKLDAIWKEPQTTSNGDSTKPRAEKGSSGKDSAFTYKSATLGSSSIMVNKIQPKGVNIIRDDFYSGWFQLLPSSAFAGKAKRGTIGNYTLTITVKEANSYGVSAQKLASYLSSSTGDLNSIIKQLLPSSK